MSRKLTRRHAQMVAVSQYNFILNTVALRTAPLYSGRIVPRVTISESDSFHPTWETWCHRSVPAPSIHVCHLEWHTSPQTLLASHSWVSVQHFYYWPKWQYCFSVFLGYQLLPLLDHDLFSSYLLCHNLSLVIFIKAYSAIISVYVHDIATFT